MTKKEKIIIIGGRMLKRNSKETFLEEIDLVWSPEDISNAVQAALNYYFQRGDKVNIYVERIDGDTET
jgi:hypothetical protein